ncbi:PREDICTED: F-box/kelch-repeat protein At3g06240-like [Camelina sativa]|uniref:F-box/kelch-repeat protein At3g06240-like n=1 Tax=Camelina sativa TaxID=90675 RepID=A0ABM0V6D4_CAMSA|nr:PREDICTED: F-box/kelch-repeat protein At3g06240-like [Camelina sativa]
MASNTSDVFLYNPTTGESKRIPDVPEYLRSSSSVTWSWFSYGFGFDPLTNDYKVVKFNVDNDNYVYSLKKDSWRRICNIPCRRVYSRTSVELNGAIHWISLISGGESPKVVTAFDLNTEKLRHMPLPDLTEECDHIYGGYTVGTVKGRLCVVSWCFEMHDVIWVMNEYGVGSSWSKIRIGVSYCQVMIPLCSTRNDEEVFLLINKDLVLYYFERNTWRSVKIRGVESGKLQHANTYVESLISPNSYGLQR